MGLLPADIQNQSQKKFFWIFHIFLYFFHHLNIIRPDQSWAKSLSDILDKDTIFILSKNQIFYLFLKTF